ncbi:phage tail protein [Gynuella sunshinyii]|uniref:Phage tail region protein n=1 Tax=Gynuella sunshinyii YC6258 TaxID=1445510 RepID=A0A0C5VV37_9GAMM|nr:phage tail protein [Gynuella sunshinyii]AJQ94239.1 hypothetical Protein YC6258_02201 [Gynuella sunshinyii YC6258]
MPIDPGSALVGYRFVVVILTTGLPNTIDIAFQDISGLKMSRTINRRGRMTTLANELPDQTLTLKRGVFSNVSPLTTANTLESLFWGTRLLRKDLLISVLNSKGNPANAWIVSNAYLESWDWDALNAENNQILIESMSFKYSDLKYVSLNFG